MEAMGEKEDPEERDRLIKALSFSPSFPSGLDILIFLGDKDQKFSIIAQRDPVTSKVSGFYFLMKKGNTPSIPKFPFGQNRSEELRSWFNDSRVGEFNHFLECSGYNSVVDIKDSETGEEEKSNNQKILDEVMDKFNIKIRYVPVRGYEYQKGFGFLKNK